MAHCPIKVLPLLSESLFNLVLGARKMWVALSNSLILMLFNLLSHLTDQNKYLVLAPQIFKKEYKELAWDHILFVCLFACCLFVCLLFVCCYSDAGILCLMVECQAAMFTYCLWRPPRSFLLPRSLHCDSKFIIFTKRLQTRGYRLLAN